MWIRSAGPQGPAWLDAGDVIIDLPERADDGGDYEHQVTKKKTAHRKHSTPEHGTLAPVDQAVVSKDASGGTKTKPEDHAKDATGHEEPQEVE